MNIKIIFILFLFLTNTLFTQTWNLIYNEIFLPIAPYTGGHERLEANSIAAYNDLITISRSVYKDLLITYNQTNQEWEFLNNKEICSMIDSIHNLKPSDLKDILNIVYDLEGSLWAVLNYNIIISLKNNTAQIFTEVFNKNLNKYFPIKQCRDIKIDKSGNIWAIIVHENTETMIKYYSLCKLKDGKFITIDYPTCGGYGYDGLKKNIAFDYSRRVFHTNTDTLYIIENDEVIQKICILDLPNGYSYYSKIVVNSKNVIYTINENLMLYVLNGDNYTFDDFVQKKERLLTPTSQLNYYYMCIDSSDNVWITGISTCTLYRLDTAGNWNCYDVPKFNTSIDEWCYKENLEADKYGKIWIPADGIISCGLYCFDPNGIISVNEQPSTEKQGLPDVWIRNLYPNPSNSDVTVDFFLEHSVLSQLEAKLFNIMGIEVKDIKDSFNYNSHNMKATFKFNVADVPKGSYIVSIKAGKNHKFWMLMVGY